MALRVAMVAVCALAVAAALPPERAAAAPGVQFGIQDDAWLEFGPGTLRERVAEIDRLALDIGRCTLNWYRIELSPGRYYWRRSDRLLRALRAAGLDPVVTLWGTPEWANDGPPNAPPRLGSDFQSFARAVAKRYRFVHH